MESISQIRQMMAESRFFEALKTAEVCLSSATGGERKNLLQLFLELLELQDMNLPEELILEVAEASFDDDVDVAVKWLEKLPVKVSPHFYLRRQLLKIKISEQKGRLEELYSLIAELKVRLFEARVPAKIALVDNLVQRYFKNDFQLKLQDLALDLMLGNITSAETFVSDLIYSSVERASSLKGTKEKLLSVAEVIGTASLKSQLEVYRSYCLIAARGLSEKSEYKKLVEMIVYFDDFRFQLLVLDLLEKLQLSDVAPDYAAAVRANKNYNFVTIEKYFAHLKKYFSRGRTASASPVADPTHVDVTLAAPLAHLPGIEETVEPVSEEESLLMAALKYQSFSPADLIELSIGFIQSGYYRAAAFAAERAGKATTLNQEFLKAAYLRGTCLARLGDHRAVLDLSLQSLDRSERQDDILSFLYLQAEAETRLGLVKDARRTLKKILSIDAGYRLTKERLERLDEI